MTRFTTVLIMESVIILWCNDSMKSIAVLGCYMNIALQVYSHIHIKGILAHTKTTSIRLDY
jgi:hypothetical protein